LGDYIKLRLVTTESAAHLPKIDDCQFALLRRPLSHCNAALVTADVSAKETLRVARTGSPACALRAWDALAEATVAVIPADELGRVAVQTFADQFRFKQL